MHLFVDLAIAIAALAGSLVLVGHGGIGPVRSESRELDLVAVTLAAGSTLPLVGWRRLPLGVFGFTAASCVLLTGLGYRMDLLIGPTTALYLFAASREPEVPWSRRSTVTVVGMFVAYLGAAALAQGNLPGIELIHTGLAWAVAWFAGERTRLRREQIADLGARALHAERDLERERQLAAAEERARIARDLHDTAGHAINAIAVRAGAARLRHKKDPERSLLALEAIEKVARQTAEEIDQIVVNLRGDPAGDGVVEAPIGLASLDTLVASHRQAGLEVTVGASGTPRRLCAATDQAAYRILQESLTNAARHGRGSVRIELEYGHDSIELSITNPTSGGDPQITARGHGLIGMRERATLIGGTLEASNEDGVFHIRARLPNGGHAA